MFISVILLVGLLIAPTHGGMARLSWPWWLVAYQEGLPASNSHPGPELINTPFTRW